MPVFGIRKPERRVVLRTGAYGIVTNINGKVMIIQNKLGKFCPAADSCPAKAMKRHYTANFGRNRIRNHHQTQT